MENETWLSLRDKKTGKITKHIKINSEVSLKGDIASAMKHAYHLVENIDCKFMTIIKTSIVYHFVGLMDFETVDESVLKNIKYNLQAELLKLVDATLYDLNSKMCNPYDIKKMIDVITNIYYCVRQIPNGKDATSVMQNKMVESMIIRLEETHNQYIIYLINQYKFQRDYLVSTVPQNFAHLLQISNTIDTANFNIVGIEQLKIEEKPELNDL